MRRRNGPKRAELRGVTGLPVLGFVILLANAGPPALADGLSERCCCYILVEVLSIVRQ